MRPSQTSAALRRIASLIDQSRRPDRALVAKDLRRVLAALGGQDEIYLTLQYSNPPAVQDDGTLAGQFEQLCSSAGCSVEGWEGDAMQVKMPYSARPAFLDLMYTVKAGKQGPGLQAMIAPYLENPIQVSAMNPATGVIEPVPGDEIQV